MWVAVLEKLEFEGLGQWEIVYFFFCMMVIFYGESDGAKIFCAKCNVCKNFFAIFLQSVWHKNVFNKICSKYKKMILPSKKIKKPIVPHWENAIFSL